LCVVAQAVFLAKAGSKYLYDLGRRDIQIRSHQNQGGRYPKTSTTKACTETWGRLTDHWHRSCL
jgi:hypothetical protein